MADRTKDMQRAKAEERFRKARTIETEAKELIEVERASVRAKTDRLKGLRVTKEANDARAEATKRRIRRRRPQSRMRRST